MILCRQLPHFRPRRRLTACSGVRFEDLSQGQAVTFTVGQGPKGPRAENVKAE